MAPSKRRKGKQATARSTATRQSTAAAAAAAAAAPAADKNSMMGQIMEAGSSLLDSHNNDDIGGNSCIPQAPTILDDENDIILASSKRRGAYECDYCHGDISQLPRIRCAVCEDFDLCLDCFTSKLGNQAPAASSSLSSSPVKRHNPSKHGYRVCDSTRFPIFPTARQWSTKAFAQSVATQFPPSAGSSTPNPNNHTSSADSFSTPHKNLSNNAEDDASDPYADTKESGGVTSLHDGAKPTDENTVFEDDDEVMESAVESTKKESRTLTSAEFSSSTLAAGGGGGYSFRADDPKMYWTVEEDLRLLEGIQNHGIGNWIEIAETVSGQGKTPKRCMERYLDDYLGRYGHILPMYTLIPYEDPIELGGFSEENNNAGGNNTDQTGSNTADESNTESTREGAAVDNNSVIAVIGSIKSTPVHASTSADATLSGLDDLPRASKRRATHFRSPAGAASSNCASTLASRKKYKVVLTESIEGYQAIWPNAYCPSTRSHVVPGSEVSRDQMYKAEQAYIKAISSVQTKAEVDAIHKEWSETKLNKPLGPSVLPPRPEDVMTMPGAELAGFMPRREDFDIEWENDAEEAIGDMEFLPGDSEEDKQLKLKVLAIYNSKLDKREARKKFIITRQLWDYQRLHQDFEKLPRDERDLVLRMRLFERFHTPQEHKIFLDDILKAKRLRKEIAKLQMYRRLGIRTLVEAEKYELDKARRQFHKTASAASGSQNNNNNDGSKKNDDSGKPEDSTASTSLWRQYRTSERRVRKSVNRGVSFESAGSASASEPRIITNDLRDIESAQGGKSADPTVDSSNSKQGRQSNNKNNNNAVSNLSPQEAELCENVGLTHDQYRDIKKVLIQESLEAGLLDKESSGSSRRSLIKMDLVRRENLIEFFIRAGWVSTRLSHIARSLPQSQSQS
ncbi:hypothetical protein ACA910_006345 [Epithemia clementina (nom. ined.)]